MTEADAGALLEELTQFIYLAPVGIIRFRSDGAIGMANPMAVQLLMQLSPGGLLSNAFEALAPLVPDLADRVDRFADDAGTVLSHHCSDFRDAMKNVVVVSVTVNRVNAETYMAIVEDVTRLVDQERLLFEDAQRFRAIFNHVRDYAIFTVDVSGRIDEWNPSIERLGGWAAHDVEGEHLSIFFAEGSVERVDQLLADARRRGSTETEGWLKRRDGTQRWADTVITALPDATGGVSGFVVVSRDMSDRKRLDDELRRLATTDPLTGAFNRRWGAARLEDAIERNRRDGTPVSVLMMDIDHFKTINDTFGHDAGDAALCAFVDACTKALRADDPLVRWGGEEFLAILTGSRMAAAAAVADRIRVSVASATVETADGTPIAMTVSIGVAGADDGDGDDLIRRADKALYQAKSNGRNRVVLSPIEDVSANASGAEAQSGV